MKIKQETWPSTDLVQTLGGAVRDLRREGNRNASKSMARFTILFIGFLIAILVRFCII